MASFWACAAFAAGAVLAVIAEEHVTPRSCGGDPPVPSSCRPAPGPGEDPQPLGTPNVLCESTKGSFTIEMHPEWSPIGAARFLEAVSDGVYDGTCIYRVVKDQAVQFGYPKDEALRTKWWAKGSLKDDPQIFRNPNFHRGMIAYAGGGKNTRGLDLFITFMTGNANGTPRAPWETPFGIIDEKGMQHVTAFNSEYGDMRTFGGMGPDMSKGYESVKKTHPNIDYLGKCKLVYPDTPHEDQQQDVVDVNHDVDANTRLADSRPAFLNKHRSEVKKNSESESDRWVIAVKLHGGTSLTIPLWPVLFLGCLLMCMRVALPKFTKMLIKKLTRCDI